MTTRANNTSQRKRGFSVIEAFVGISILLIGITGPLALVHTNLQGARFSRDQITSVYLAQDAIETVRQIRDSNFLEGNSPISGLTECVSQACTVDGIDGTVNGTSGSCDAGDPDNVSNNFRLEVDRESGAYAPNISGDDDSRFWRCVQIEPTSSHDARIVATVIFNTGRFYQAYETTGYLSDWYPSD